MISGVAYNLAIEAKHSKADREAFADEHGLPAQRFFNLACIAYGANPRLFADVVEKGYLPKERAEGCEEEYKQVAYAVSKLLGPHVDTAAAEKMKAKVRSRKPGGRHLFVPDQRSGR